MKRKIIIISAAILSSVFVCGTSLAVLNRKTDANIMTKNGSTYVVNTTQLCKKIKGFKGATPLMIYIKSNTVVKIQPLQNMDTPNFFNRAAKSLESYYIGKKVNKIINADVDAVSGATYSSKSIIQNVKSGLEYYNRNK